MESYEDRILRTRGKEYLEKKQAVAAKCGKYGTLSLNHEEHDLLGTGPDILSDKPGKTLGEVLNDEEILNFLRESVNALAGFKKEVSGYYSPQAGGVLESQIERLKIDLRYLKKIGRLPEEFKDFDVDAISPAE